MKKKLTKILSVSTESYKLYEVKITTKISKLCIYSEINHSFSKWYRYTACLT